MVAGDIAEFALKAAKQADYAEARFESATINEFTLKNGVLEASESLETQGLCVRLIVNGAQGAAFTNLLSRASVKAAVNRALKLAKQSAKIVKSPAKLSPDSGNKADYSVAQRIPLSDVSSDVKVHELVNVDKAMLSVGVKLPARFFTLRDEIREKYYVNSDGSSVRSNIPRVLFDYMLTAAADGKTVQRMFSFGASAGWEAFKKWSLADKLAEEVKMLGKIMSTAQPCPHGELDVVLSPELVGIASHESVGHPYEADRILGREAAQAGESFVTRELLGTKIGSDVVNVVDDPRLPGSYGYYLFDDEGVKASRRYLIKNGLITGFLQNRWSAAQFGISSNGAARANNWDAEPIVRMANTYVMAGDYATEELFRDIKKGI
ncbi:MAG: TldD/PmbA family protein, partial [Candidatus Aenigmatarchaeota archaeon]